MQDFSKPQQKQQAGPAVSIPKIPLMGVGKFILTVLLAVIIFRWLYPPVDAVALNQRMDQLDSRFLDLNATKANKDGVVYQLNQLQTLLNQQSSKIDALANKIDALSLADNRTLTNFNDDLRNLKQFAGSLTDRLQALEVKINQTDPTDLTSLTSDGNLPATNSTKESPYLCDVSGVPADLLFQYTFQCTCDLRKVYGPYFNAGSACHVNNDQQACACYYSMCNSKVGLC